MTDRIVLQRGASDTAIIVAAGIVEKATVACQTAPLDRGPKHAASAIHSGTASLSASMQDQPPAATVESAPEDVFVHEEMLFGGFRNLIVAVANLR